MRSDDELFREALTQGGWLLCETKFRAGRLRHSLSCASGIWTVADALRTLLERSSQLRHQAAPNRAARHPAAPNRDETSDHDVSDVVRQTVVARLLRSRPSTVEGGSAEPADLRVLCRFFDRVRLSVLTEGVFAAAMDELGDSAPDAHSLADAARLLDRYREEQQHLATFDRIGLIERAVEHFSSLPAGRFPFPNALYLDQPSSFSPLEEELWRALARHVPVTIVLPSYLQPHFECISENAETSRQKRRLAAPPSLRHWVPVLHCAHTLAGAPRISLAWVGRSNFERGRLIPVLFDSETALDTPAPSELPELREYRCRKNEVRAIAKTIKNGLENGVPLGEWHIVVPELGCYAGLLRTVFADEGIPLTIPRGRRAEELPAGSYAAAVIAVLFEPSTLALRQLLHHPWTQICPPEAFARDGITGLAGHIVEILDILEFLGLETDLTNPERWAEPLAVFCASDENSRLGLPSSLQAASTWLQEYVDGRRALDEAVLTPDCLRKQARKSIRQWRAKLSKSLPQSGDDAASRLRRDNVGAIRRVHRILDLTARTIREWDIGVPNRERVTEFAQVVSALFKNCWLPEDPDPDAVAVTEPLDLRGEWGRRTVLLGASADAYPGRPADLASGLDPLDIASSRISDFGDPRHRIDESHALLAHVFYSSEQLLLSFPDEAENGEAEPADFLRLLSTVVAPLQDPAAEPPPELPALASPAPKSGESGHIARVQALLAARHSPTFSPCDGELGSVLEMGASLGSLIPKDADGKRVAAASARLSVSALETLAFCPHRFFFQNILRLSPPITERLSRPAEVGTFVHQVLERFFSAVDSSVLMDVDPAAAVAAMLKQLEVEREKSPLPWHHSAVWRAEWIRLRAGLTDEPSASRPGTGPLRSAIEMQRSVICSEICATEWRFGSRKVPPLRIETPLGGVDLIGTVDRIDRISTELGPALAVWDYKTGAGLDARTARRDLLAGAGLQVPLYAAAVTQLFGETLPVLSGGLILLARWQDTQSVRNPLLATAAVVELLSIAPTGNGKFARDFGAATERISSTSAQAAALVERIGRNSFHQRLETPVEVCERCEFRGICARDERFLEAKTLQEAACAPAAQLHSPLPRRPKIEFQARVSHPLSREQQAACATDCHIALSAGAGSGKTSVLTTRCVQLLLQGEPLESIAAITFTEKAASELRARIAIRIEQLLRGDSLNGEIPTAEQLSRLRDAGVYLSLAQIGTIHSFASMVIASDPLAAGLGTSREVLPGGEQQQMLLQAVRLTIRDPRNREDAEALFHMGVSAGGLSASLANLYRQRLLLRDLLHATASDPDMSRLEARLVACTEARIRQFVAGAQGELRDWLEALPPYLQPDKAKRTADDVASISRFAEVARSVIEEWRPGAERARLSAGIQRLVSALGADPAFSAKRKDFQRFVHSVLEPFYGKAKNGSATKDWRQEVLWIGCPEGELERRAIQTMQHVVRLLARLQEQYTALKRQHRSVDFDDLMLGALRVVRSPAGGKAPHAGIERLRQRVRHILVDEFQDTDRDQWNVVRSLTLDVSTPAISDAARTTFVVGDVQQAIYGFRGGDPEVWRESVGSLLDHGGKALDLCENYRSDPALVRFFNALFPVLFNGDGIRSSFLTAKRTSKYAGGERVYFLTDQTPGKGGIGDARSGERLALFLREVLDDLQVAEEASKFPALRGERFPIVAVLCRTVNQMESLHETLTAAGLDCRASGVNALLDSPGAQLVENLLGALLPVPDPIALAGVLRSPLIGLPDDQLYRLGAWLGGEWLRFYEAGMPESGPLHEAVSLLHSWREKLRAESTSVVLSDVLRQFDVLGLLREAGETELAEQVEACLTVIRRAEVESAFGLSAYAAREWIRARRIDGDVGAPLDGADVPILLMTAHSAKGLEFPMVVLPSLSQAGHEDRDFLAGTLEDGTAGESLPFISIRLQAESGRRSLTTVGHEMLRAAELARSAAEERRLFYVSCTRAREYLVLASKSPKEWAQQPADSLSEAARLSKLPLDWLAEIFRPALAGQAPDGATALVVGPTEGPVHIPLIATQGLSELIEDE